MQMHESATPALRRCATPNERICHEAILCSRRLFAVAGHLAARVRRDTVAKFDLSKVDFATRKTAEGEDYNTVNPKGKVPALRLDDGEVLTEGAAIVQYIADKQGATQLAPAAGTKERVRLQEWLN